jgi:hypothetical protein
VQKTIKEFMAQVIVEKNFDNKNKQALKTTTKECFFCKALFPIEYKHCPSCSMLR